VLAPRDRQSEAQLRYSRAIDRYTGGPFGGHLVIVRSRKLDDVEPWSLRRPQRPRRLSPSWPPRCAPR
jgi:hypothetical protein